MRISRLRLSGPHVAVVYMERKSGANFAVLRCDMLQRQR